MAEIDETMVTELKREAYETQRRSKPPVLSFGLRRRKIAGGSYVPGFDSLLPTHEGGSFTEIVQERSRQNGGVDILVMGPANGRLLLECARWWPLTARLFGLTALPSKEYFSTTPPITIEEELKNLGIPNELGDIQDLPNSLPDNFPWQFDFVVVTDMFRHLADPIAVIAGMGEILKRGGLGYARGFQPKMATVEDERMMIEYGSNHPGFKQNLLDSIRQKLSGSAQADSGTGLLSWDLVLQKGTSDFRLPFTPSEIEGLSPYRRIVYRHTG